MLGAAHYFQRFVYFRKREAVGDDLAWVDDAALHQADGFAHGFGVSAEAGIHSRFRKWVRPPSSSNVSGVVMPNTFQ